MPDPRGLGCKHHMKSIQMELGTRSRMLHVDDTNTTSPITNEEKSPSAHALSTRESGFEASALHILVPKLSTLIKDVGSHFPTSWAEVASIEEVICHCLQVYTIPPLRCNCQRSGLREARYHAHTVLSDGSGARSGGNENKQTAKSTHVMKKNRAKHSNKYKYYR